jgi:predicted acetyltransferase
VLPTHRRRGILRAMMRAQIDDCHERGESVADLWASEDSIYGRFGYGIASFSAEIDLPRSHAAYDRSFSATGYRASVVQLTEAEKLVAPIWERVASETPGMFARTPAWWQTRALGDPAWQRAGRGEKQCVVLQRAGVPAAYALYRLTPTFDRGIQTGSVDVVEAMGETPEATAAVWRFLSISTGWRESGPLSCLAARSYAATEPIVVEVSDDFCPWNAGRWRVGNRGIDRTEAAVDLRCDVSALGSVYLGGFTWTNLARALRVEELSKGGIARADALFVVDRTPWCPEIF